MPDQRDRRDLRADCARCFGLCCVAPAFSASADFAIDKAAGQPCPHLGPDFGCGIHAQLRPRGFPGCAAYDCFGAGQKVAQVTFGGQDWRQAPHTARQMFAAFTVVRQLHELLWYLAEALALPAARPLRGELRRALGQTERLAGSRARTLVALDVAGHRQRVNDLLIRASELARSALRPPGSGADYRGADLTGAGLRGAGLRGASLRGARLVRADLAGADLTGADLTGADLRAADLRGADLAGAIFLTQSQLDAARGDAGTGLPASLARPAHWRPAAAPADDTLGENPGGKAGRRCRTVGMAGSEREVRAAVTAGVPISTADLVLQPVSAADAAALTAGDFSRIRPGEGWPHEDSLDGLRMAAQGLNVCWLITLGAVVVGECGTHAPPDPDGVVEIGYGLAAPYRGRGYGRQTVRALAHWLLGQPGVTAVLAHTNPGNVPSRRSLVSAGFRFEGETGGQCRYRLTGQSGGSE